MLLGRTWGLSRLSALGVLLNMRRIRTRRAVETATSPAGTRKSESSLRCATLTPLVLAPHSAAAGLRSCSPLARQRVSQRLAETDRARRRPYGQTQRNNSCVDGSFPSSPHSSEKGALVHER
jgi:hypothetical protein